MAKQRRPATIRDVATATGMSISTISRALRNPGLLRPATRDMVDQAIARLDYRPSLTAQSLRGRKTNLVLVVVPSLSPFFLEVFRGAEQAADETGYGVLVGHTDRLLDRERAFIDQTSAGFADGMILVTSVNLPALSTMRHMPPLIVALDVNSGTELPTVRVDHTAGAAEATGYLIEAGHRRIGHILGPAASGMTTHRLEGYRDALRRAGIPYDPALCTPGEFTVESGEKGSALLLDLADPPTAIFAANDQMAIGAMRTARCRGIRVPRDLSIIGFDDERMAALYDPPISTVRIPTFDLGYRAMRQMARLLNGEAIDRDIVFETELAVRGSTLNPELT